MVWAAVGVAALGVGAGIYQNTKANKTTNKAVDAQTQLASQQADLAQQQYQDTSALGQSGRMQLQQLVDFGMLPPGVQSPEAPDYGLESFLQTGTLPTALQPGALPAVPQLDTLGTHALPSVADTTALNRDVLEQQFGRAREATIEQAPERGGALARDLTSLEGGRALGVTDIYSRRNELQYQQDLADAQQKNALQVQTGMTEFNQANQEAQRVNQLNTSLFGVGTDIAQQGAIRATDLRKALYSAALGLPTNAAGLALGGLSNASAGYANVASTGLKQSAQGLDLLSTGVGLGLPGVVRQVQAAQNPYGLTPEQSAGVGSDLQKYFVNNPALY